MTMQTCESVRDRMPALEAGMLTAEEAVAVERHLGACPSCAQERDAVLLVRASAPAVPAGLEARIAHAVRTGAPVRTRTRPMPSFALAAGVTFALLTGGVLVRSGIGPAGSAEEPGSTDVTLGWPTVSDPILRAAPVLNGLTVEELESLLAELES